MKTLARFVTRHPWLVVVLLVVLTLFFGFKAFHVERRADLWTNLPAGETRLAEFNDFRRDYGSGNDIILVLTGKDILSPDSLLTVDRLTREIRALDGVEQVTSITDQVEFQGVMEDLRREPSPSLPAASASTDSLRQSIMSDTWYVGRLVSYDGHSTIIRIILPDSGSLDESTAKIAEIKDLVAEERGGLTAGYVGTAVMNEQIDSFLSDDIIKLFPVVLIAVFLVLFLTFRSLSGVFLPLTTVLISVVWTVGLMSLLHHPLSLVSNIIPVLLIGVGSAYGLHIVARFREESRAGLDKAAAVQSAVERSGFAVWMAALTTMAGFGSLALSKLAMIFDFGVFSAFGVAAAFVVSITLIPAILMIVPARRKWTASASAAPAGAAHLARLARFAAVHHLTVLLLAGLICLAALAGWPRLKTTFELSDFLPEGSDHRRTEALVDKDFGGSSEINVLVGGKLDDPSFLAEIQSFQSSMTDLGVGGSLSLVDLLAHTNRLMHGGDPSFEKMPDDPVLVSQYLFLISLSSSPEDLKQFMNSGRTQARISARISGMMPSGDCLRLIDSLEQRAADIFGPETPVTVTGTPVIQLAMMDIIRDEQIRNIGASLLAVIILVALAFRSLAVSLACAAPIALTILYNLGLMGWTGLPLNCATATMASLATGIGIDYGIHFYRRYLEEHQGDRGAVEAVGVAARTTGGAIVANTLAVGVGFAVLLLSGLSLFRSFGALIAMTMLLTALGALIVIPAIIGAAATRAERRIRKAERCRAEDERSVPRD